MIDCQTMEFLTIILGIFTLSNTDIVFMEGGTSSFNLARELKANTKATIIVLNPAKLHKAIASDFKTDKNDAYLIAEYARDKNWEKWCVLEVLETT